jgi:opacity protein-like surface antigen
MSFSICAAVFLAALVTASHASAQARPVIVLSPGDPSRWDFSTHVGWVGGNKSAIAPDWNDWYDTASIDVSGGYYWTRHLKLELDVSTTAAAGMFVDEHVLLPGDSFPYFRQREHTFRTTSATAGMAYQFFENSWFHPFVGGGIAVVHERERTGVAQPLVYFRDPQTRVVLPHPDPFDRESTDARPFAMLGLKAYVSERAFIRTDLRISASTRQAESVALRLGVGFDF